MSITIKISFRIREGGGGGGGGGGGVKWCVKASTLISFLHKPN
jgi:hypothetical protein